VLVSGVSFRGLDPRSIMGKASRDLLNPLHPPGWRFEGIRKILCFVNDLAATELHDAR
jgi:hypothetical protein